MAVQPGLCRTWSETPKTGFLTTRLICEQQRGVSAIIAPMEYCMISTYVVFCFNKDYYISGLHLTCSSRTQNDRLSCKGAHISKMILNAFDHTINTLKLSLCNYLKSPKMSLVVRKPVFGVFDQVRHKPGCTTTEDS